jgi:hypothetical protein
MQWVRGLSRESLAFFALVLFVAGYAQPARMKNSEKTAALRSEKVKGQKAEVTAFLS